MREGDQMIMSCERASNEFFLAKLRGEVFSLSQAVRKQNNQTSALGISVFS